MCRLGSWLVAVLQPLSASPATWIRTGVSTTLLTSALTPRITGWTATVSRATCARRCWAASVSTHLRADVQSPVCASSISGPGLPLYTLRDNRGSGAGQCQLRSKARQCLRWGAARVFWLAKDGPSQRGALWSKLNTDRLYIQSCFIMFWFF